MGIVGQRTVRKTSRVTHTNKQNTNINTAEEHTDSSELTIYQHYTYTEILWDEPTGNNIIYLGYMANISEEKNPLKNLVQEKL